MRVPQVSMLHGLGHACFALGLQAVICEREAAALRDRMEELEEDATKGDALKAFKACFTPLQPGDANCRGKQATLRSRSERSRESPA